MDSKSIIIGAVVLAVAIGVVAYLLKKPILYRSGVRSNTGGCACTYTYKSQEYVPFNNWPSADAIFVAGTTEILKAECDKDPGCKGFVYDPSLNGGYLKSAVAPTQTWQTNGMGLYVKNV